MNSRFLAGITLLAVLSTATAQSDWPGPDSAGATSAGKLFSNGGEYGGEGGGSHAWLTTEYLRWKVKDAPVPFPLLTTGTTGILGDPTTQVLYGGGSEGLGQLNGLRVSAGMWCNADTSLGVEVSGFALQRGGESFAAASDANGSPLLARPLVTAAGGNAVLPIATPNNGNGSFYASATSRLYGAEINLDTAAGHGDRYALDLLWGFRYLNLTERLELQSTSTTLFTSTFSPLYVPVFPGIDFNTTTIGPGASTSLLDEISARNRIYAPQVGARLSWYYGVMTLGLSGKVGLGWNNQTVEVSGRNTTSSPGGTTTTNLNLFGVPVATSTSQVLGYRNTSPNGFLGSDPGATRNATSFVVVPEIGATVGVNLFPWMTVTAGYNFLYINRVARPGDQFNPVAPFSPAPTTVHESDYFVHGLTTGVQLRW
jgi:hypothetical protein